jgi:penicillin G amidase
MSAKLRRFLLVFTGIFLILCLFATALGYSLPRRSFPKTEGEIALEGLQAPVEIIRDSYGVPHIYAASSHDLFLAQGYVHAQDRFWQMDFWRHVGSARLSELFGESQLETDIFLRTLGWRRVVEREVAGIDGEMRLALDAYAAGVNAYLSSRSRGELSLEHTVLGLLNSGYQPEPWQIEHTLTYAKMMAWDLGGNMGAEIDRAIFLGSLSPEQVADLFPPYPAEHPVIVTGTGTAAAPENDPASLARLPGMPALLEAASQKTASLNSLLGGGFEGVGSNSWVLSGDLTSTGTPLLADDPHLGEQIPSIWYEVGLHCQPVSRECPYDVTGYSFASAPGVIVGHNQRIAWGVTNLGPDVQDLYIERINPENPYQYEVNGEWVDMQILRETIKISDADPVEVEVRYTRHGPIISDAYGPLEGFFEKSNPDLPEGQYALALRWTALDESYTFRAILKYNQAGSWEEFRQALQDFDVPSQNFIYADVDGNIGYQTPGKIPIRSAGNGRLPVPGWTDEYEWVDFIPFDELPSVLNPPEGYIVTANNAVVGDAYPYLLSLDWDRGHRARRIVDMIESAPGPIDIAYIQTMHGDNLNLNAAALVPLLLQATQGDERLAGARAMLEGWDYQNHMSSAPAALFEVFFKNLLELTFVDDLPEDKPPTGGSQWYTAVRRLADQPTSPWWDHKDTAEVEDRDQIFHQALAAALSELESLQGRDPARWSWGDLHTLTFSNPTLGRSGPDPVRALFNRGPYPTSGGSGIVNATSWNASLSYTVRWLPSFRMIVDMGDFTNSLAINTTGQSGHAYHPNYINQADMWRRIEYRPQLWERSQVEAGASAVLRLVP